MSESPLQPEPSGLESSPPLTPTGQEVPPAIPTPVAAEPTVQAELVPSAEPTANEPIVNEPIANANPTVPAEPAVVPYATPAVHGMHPADPDAIAPRPPLLLASGILGLSACSVGLLVFLLACAGFNAVFKVSWLPLLLGACGFVVALVGANVHKSQIREDTHVLAALFSSCLGIIGGLVEMTVWLGWQTFR